MANGSFLSARMEGETASLEEYKARAGAFMVGAFRSERTDKKFTLARAKSEYMF